MHEVSLNTHIQTHATYIHIVHKIWEVESLWPNFSHIFTLCHCHVFWCQVKHKGTNRQGNIEIVLSKQGEKNNMYIKFVFIYINMYLHAFSMFIKNLHPTRKYTKMLKTYGNWHNISKTCLIINLTWAPSWRFSTY